MEITAIQPGLLVFLVNRSDICVCALWAHDTHLLLVVLGSCRKLLTELGGKGMGQGGVRAR